MRSPRVFLLLGPIAAAIVLLVSSEVVARDLAKTFTSKQNGVNDAKHNGYGGGYPGGGCPGDHSGGYPGRGGHCHCGCCGSGYYSHCRCCASAAEAEQKAAKVKPQN